MPLVVAPLDGFDSLISLEAADAYWASLGGNATWDAALPARKEGALRVGTVFILARKPFSAYLSPTVHPNIGYATAQAARRDLDGTLYSDADSAGRVIQETVGPISTTYESGVSSYGRFPIIDDLLRGYTLSGSSTVFLERA